MKKILFLVFFFVVVVFSFSVFTVSSVFAEGDVLLPAFKFYQVVPGEKFSFDLVYKSFNGGAYRLLVTPFSYDEEGMVVPLEMEEPFVFFADEELSFDKGEEKYIGAYVRLPDDVPDGDYYYRLSIISSVENSVFNVSASSMIYLSVGDVSDVSGKLSSADFVEDATDGVEGVYERLSYGFEYQGDRAFVLVPTLELLYQNGEKQDIEGNHSFILPKKTVSKNNWVNLSEDKICLEDFVKEVSLKVSTFSGKELSRIHVPFKHGYCISAYENKTSPLKRGFRERRFFQFLYYPMFRTIAFLIGLTFLLYSLYLFYSGRK